MAVLLCNTVGFEAIHAYRSMVSLGNALAETGLAAFRFDFAGTGNSSGDAEAADLVAAWQQNIVDQVRDLKERWGFKNVAVVGFRLGAPLVTSVAGDLDVTGITLWEPVTRGRSFVREIRAVAQFAEDGASGESGKVESGGFVFTAATLQAIGELSLDPETVPADTPVLLISRGTNAKFNTESLANRNPFEELRSREFDRMVCEPHYTELPHYSIARMQHWHSSLDTAAAAGFSRPQPRHTARVDARDEGQAVEESIFRTADGALFGIASRPAGYVPGSTPTAVLSNAGSVCSIGPNRIYVQTARALAAAGMEVVRFDLHNLGDSVTGDVDAANAPYPQSATEDVSRVLTHCRTAFGSTSFVLAGLCSGSHTSYHFALDHDDPDDQSPHLLLHTGHVARQPPAVPHRARRELLQAISATGQQLAPPADRSGQLPATCGIRSKSPAATRPQRREKNNFAVDASSAFTDGRGSPATATTRAQGYLRLLRHRPGLLDCESWIAVVLQEPGSFRGV